MPRPEPPHRPSRLTLALVIGVAWALAHAFAQGADLGARFDAAWQLVADRYWHLERAGVDWDAAREELRPRALAAASEDAFYAVLEELYERLNDGHTVFVPPAKVAEVRAKYGDLPCIMLLGSASGPLAPDSPGAALGGATLVRAQAGVPTLAREGRAANVTYGLLGTGVGYVRLPDLATDGTAAAVRGSVAELEEAGAWALVLDLRGNPGGRLVTMMQVAGVFVRGFLWRAVTNWTLPMPYPAIGLRQTALPLAVLIDGDVNSAAEGLAGGLQAAGRAVVIGERSAGNVETLLPFCLRDGSQAWVATGVLAPIGGPTWEGRGVTPDVAAAPDEALSVATAYLESRRGRP